MLRRELGVPSQQPPTNFTLPILSLIISRRLRPVTDLLDQQYIKTRTIATELLYSFATMLLIKAAVHLYVALFAVRAVATSSEASVPSTSFTSQSAVDTTTATLTTTTSTYHFLGKAQPPQCTGSGMSREYEGICVGPTAGQKLNGGLTFGVGNGAATATTSISGILAGLLLVAALVL
ncbi:hypothetical protein LTR27_004406 [Elasticomyces elasticus]|nr:hypothetical protein LTR27_004406 [Elasticomyces elasticus]